MNLHSVLLTLALMSATTNGTVIPALALGLLMKTETRSKEKPLRRNESCPAFEPFSGIVRFERPGLLEYSPMPPRNLRPPAQDQPFSP